MDETRVTPDPEIPGFEQIFQSPNPGIEVPGSRDYEIIKEIRENSNIQLIVKDKEEDEILNLLDEFINDFKEQNNLRKIESLEKKLLKNLDENSYSELIKLKSQLNRD